ncbi:hypothetical protein A0J61_05242 [Choanephora cucurbitarum]|uniref:Uncharacterized protein n=1 Tax=Choanephora cucurbitarum TaxID=101091 RepID=A0A1C7NC83_9FUNG|nr:hypothetical protein A0J61_05242 [Choanephora cucurbitarum]
MTVAPGSVNIPPSVEQDVKQRIMSMNRSVSFNHQDFAEKYKDWLLTPTKEEDKEEIRRKSEDITTLLYRHSSSSISRKSKKCGKRRKSEDACQYLGTTNITATT